MSGEIAKAVNFQLLLANGGVVQLCSSIRCNLCFHCCHLLQYVSIFILYIAVQKREYAVCMSRFDTFSNNFYLNDHSSVKVYTLGFLF